MSNFTNKSFHSIYINARAPVVTTAPPSREREPTRENPLLRGRALPCSIPGVYRLDVGLVQESSMLLLVSEATMLVDVARREDDMKY